MTNDLSQNDKDVDYKNKNRELLKEMMTKITDEIITEMDDNMVCVLVKHPDVLKKVLRHDFISYNH